MKEHKELIKHSCDHIREVVSLGGKLPRRQVKVMRTIPCPQCQLKELLKNE